MTPLQVESCLVRVFCLAGDRATGGSLHQAIVEAARTAGLAGATAVCGKMGFGRGQRIYSDLLSETQSEFEPVVVELVDQPGRVEEFLPALHVLVQGRRLITVERAEIIHYVPASATET